MNGHPQIGHISTVKWSTTSAGRIARNVLAPLTIALAYYIGTRIGFLLTPKTEPIATFWPPNAILMGCLLLISWRRWWSVIIAVLAVHLLAQTQNGVPITTALGWFLGNVSEALLGASLLYQANRKGPLFDSVRGTVTFLCLGVILPAFATSFLDAAVVVITSWGREYWLLWTTRFFSNLLASLTLVPVILTCALMAHQKTLKAVRKRQIEALILAAAIALVTVFVYGSHQPSPNLVPVLVYAPLPLLLWVALRFGAGGLAASSAFIAITSLQYVLHRRGPFTSQSMTENVLFLQLSLASVTVPLLLLHAVFSERRRVQQELRESRTQLVDTQEQERARIARELHDDIGQQLAIIQLELHQAEEAAGTHIAASRLRLLLQNLTAKLNIVSETTRGLSHDLHPIQLEYLGLSTGLRNLCSGLEKQTGLKFHFQEEQNLPAELPPDVSLSLFRVAQEALHNVVKHSRADDVSIQINVQQNDLILRIVDNGKGFAYSEKKTVGLGLVNMKERLKALGGNVQVTSMPMRGTVVEASVPLEHRSGLSNAES